MGNLNWSDLPLETQKRLQQPKNRLSAADKQLRKKLFHGSGWINSSGQIQKFQAPREEKRVKKKEGKENSAKPAYPYCNKCKHFLHDMQGCELAVNEYPHCFEQREEEKADVGV